MVLFVATSVKANEVNNIGVTTSLDIIKDKTCSRIENNDVKEQVKQWNGYGKFQITNGEETITIERIIERITNGGGYIVE